MDNRTRAQEWQRLAEMDMRQALSSAKAIRDFVLNLVPEMAPEEQGRNESQSQDSPSL